jgi:hypothetical protein
LANERCKLLFSCVLNPLSKEAGENATPVAIDLRQLGQSRAAYQGAVRWTKHRFNAGSALKRCTLVTGMTAAVGLECGALCPFLTWFRRRCSAKTDLGVRNRKQRGALARRRLRARVPVCHCGVWTAHE